MSTVAKRENTSMNAIENLTVPVLDDVSCNIDKIESATLEHSASGLATLKGRGNSVYGKLPEIGSRGVHQVDELLVPPMAVTTSPSVTTGGGQCILQPQHQRSLFGTFAATILCPSSFLAGNSGSRSPVSESPSSLQQLMHGDHDYGVVRRPTLGIAAVPAAPAARVAAVNDGIASAIPAIPVSSTGNRLPGYLLSSSSAAETGITSSGSSHLTCELVCTPSKTVAVSMRPDAICRSTQADGTPSKLLGAVGFNTRSGFVKMTDTGATTSSNAEAMSGASVISPSSLLFDGLSMSRGELAEPEASCRGTAQLQKSVMSEHQRVIEYRLKSHLIVASMPETIGPISMPIRPRNGRRTKMHGYRATSGSNDHVFSTAMHRLPVSSTAVETDFKLQQSQQQQHRLPVASYVSGKYLVDHQGRSPGMHRSRTSPKKSLLELKSTEYCASTPADGQLQQYHQQICRSSTERVASCRLDTVGAAMVAPTSIGRRNPYYHHSNRHLAHHQSLLITPPGIPSPFLLQTGLEKALDFAEFQPMSPSSISSLSPPPHDQLVGVAAGTSQSARRSRESRVDAASGRRQPVSGEEVPSSGLLSEDDAMKGAGQKPDALSMLDMADDPLSARHRQYPCGHVTCGTHECDSWSSPSAQILVGDNIDIGADGCYWDGLQCEEEQVDQWQTTVWSGGTLGCRSEQSPRVTATGCSAVTSGKKSSTTNTTPSTSHGGGGEKRKRRLIGTDFDYNQSGGGRSGKHKQLHGTGVVGANSINLGKLVRSAAHQHHSSAAVTDNRSHMTAAIGASRSGHTANFTNFTHPSKKSRRKRKDSSGEMLNLLSEQQRQQPCSMQSADNGGSECRSVDLALVKTETAPPFTTPYPLVTQGTAIKSGMTSSTASPTRYRRRKFDRRSSTRSRTLEQCLPVNEADPSTKLLAKQTTGHRDSDSIITKRIKDKSKHGSVHSTARANRTTPSKSGKQQDGTPTSHSDTAWSKTTPINIIGRNDRKKGRQRSKVGFLQVGGQMGDGVTDVGDVFGHVITEWERYLSLGEEQLLTYELENARYFQYSDEATAMIADKDLEVWRIVEKMRPNKSPC